MTIINVKVHKLDVTDNSIKAISYKPEDTDFVRYLQEILKDVKTNQKSREYEFKSDASELYTLIKRSVYENKFEESVELSAKRLLEKESAAQTKIKHLEIEIQKGIVIHAHIKENGKDFFIICKADDIPYIDEKNLKESSGFPIKKKIFKSFIAEFDDQKIITKVLLHDTAKLFAAYWYSDYLELTPVLDNSVNTLRAFQAIDNIIFSPLKKESKADHYHLRNALVTAMKSDSSFDIIDYADEVLAKYKPVNDNVDVKKFAEKIKSLPEKYKFDPIFDIDPTAITAQVRQVVPLSDSIDLTIKDGIDTSNTIIPVMSEDKTKYIQIRSDVGYDTFIKK